MLVEGFDLVNVDFIESVCFEVEFYVFEMCIWMGYVVFRVVIRVYFDGLFRKFLVDFNDLILDFYNVFNEDDYERDKFILLLFFIKGGEKIMVVFGVDLVWMYDVFYVFSEGYFRCFGLVIFFVKNIKLELLLIVFDDVVNVIDFDY